MIFKVAAVSSNMNSFGLRQFIMVANDGAACKALGNSVRVERYKAGRSVSIVNLDSLTALGFECPEWIPGVAPPEVVREVFKA